MVKIMVPNPIFEWMIWGYHYFWKHPYVLPNCLLFWKMIFFFVARVIYCTKDDTNNTEKIVVSTGKKRYSWWFVAPWSRIEGLAGWIYFFGFGAVKRQTQRRFLGLLGAGSLRFRLPRTWGFSGWIITFSKVKHHKQNPSNMIWIHEF